MADEMVDIIDEQSKVLRRALKTQAHKDGLLHKTVIGFLMYGKDIALVRQASDRQDAGQLVSPVGGHVRAGESTVEAIKRESAEEIGAVNLRYEHVGERIFHRKVIGRDENHLFVVYEIRTDDPIKLNKEAVDIVRFTDAKHKEALKEHPEDFGDAYYFLLESFYPELLPDGYKHRWP
jgi:8-oxo-dGTP pyrophosphatase MutT (NUDIX family)